MRIVFMGTPEFAVAALEKLLASEHDIVGVITAPDQIAGRGKKIKTSAVKNYALAHNLKLLQPPKLKDPIFLEELAELKADIQVVVAFRMLPQVVWDMPPKGTFNLHASLLPQYRGAAPINHAIINGETKTGVSTFFLDKEIDTGKIIFQKECNITPEDNAGSLHDKLMHLGADLILETLKAVAEERYSSIPQEELIGHLAVLNPAPKLYKQDGELDWNREAYAILNKIRGLSPYPAAYSHLKLADSEKTYYLKIFEAEIKDNKYPNAEVGSIFTDSKTYIHVISANGVLALKEVQLEGKKRLDVLSFLRGFKLATPCSFTTLD